MDHVVANIFFIPIGILSEAPFGVEYYIWKSIISTALGNMVRGLFVGGIYWYLYLAGEGHIDVNFNIWGLASAMEAGGLMGRDRRPDGRNGYVVRRGEGRIRLLRADGWGEWEWGGT